MIQTEPTPNPESLKFLSENTISAIGSQLIMNGCYSENNQAYCALIERLPTGFVKDLRNTTNNIGMVETSGFEIAATYDWSDNLGNWRVSSEIAVLDAYDVTKADGSVEHYAGYVTGNGRKGSFSGVKKSGSSPGVGINGSSPGVGENGSVPGII